MNQGPFDMGLPGRQQAPIAPARTTSRGRRTAQMDTGTVAMAMSAMTYYWLMPALMARRKRRTTAGQQPSDTVPPAES